MPSLTRSPTAALLALAAIIALGLGLGLGLGVGLKTSPSTACNALADAIAARLGQGLLKDKDAFAEALANVGLPGLEVVDASPPSVDEAACAQASPAVTIDVAFSLSGALEDTLSTAGGKAKVRKALAGLAGVQEDHVSLSVTAGSTALTAKLHLTEAEYKELYEVLHDWIGCTLFTHVRCAPMWAAGN